MRDISSPHRKPSQSGLKMQSSPRSRSQGDLSGIPENQEAAAIGQNIPRKGTPRARAIFSMLASVMFFSARSIMPM